MNLKHLTNSKGFTLVEMTIASAIMILVVAGGYQAYQYFNTQTVKEAKKMDQVSEFSALTKDLITFTEGAGISTFYLNLPIKTKSCAENEPCIKQLDGEAFVTPSSLPANLAANTCVQFYKDAKGVLESKLAYPGKPFTDKLWSNKEIELPSTENLYATWTIKDETSAPLIMMKTRDASIFLKQIRGAVQVSMIHESSHQGLKHSFFLSDSSKEQIKELQNYPFLIYNTVYPSQYNIQEAEQIISCAEDKNLCLSLIEKARGPIPSIIRNNDAIIANMLTVPPGSFPNKVFAIKFKAMDFKQPFFKDIVDRQNLSASCKSQWGDGKQEANSYFFPSSVLSVSPSADDTSNELNHFPLNTLYIGKYTFSRGVDTIATSYVAVPIDIITFRAEATAEPEVYQLVSQLWHPTDIKKKIKIHKLTSPFVVSRKLGSSEMGIWYNPIKK